MANSWSVKRSVQWRSAVTGAQVVAVVEEDKEGNSRFMRYVAGELKQCINHDADTLFEQVEAIAAAQPEYTA